MRPAGRPPRAPGPGTQLCTGSASVIPQELLQPSLPLSRPKPLGGGGDPQTRPPGTQGLHCCSELGLQQLHSQEGLVLHVVRGSEVLSTLRPSHVQPRGTPSPEGSGREPPHHLSRAVLSQPWRNTQLGTSRPTENIYLHLRGQPSAPRCHSSNLLSRLKVTDQVRSHTRHGWEAAGGTAGAQRPLRVLGDVMACGHQVRAGRLHSRVRLANGPQEQFAGSRASPS